MTGRGQERSRLLRRLALAAGVLVLLALLFLISGHWLLALILAIPAAVAVWMYMQARGVR